MYWFFFTKPLCQEQLNTFIKGISLALEIHELQSQESGKAHLKDVTLPAARAHITPLGNSTGSTEEHGQDQHLVYPEWPFPSQVSVPASKL